MPLIALILLFVGAILVAVGHNTRASVGLPIGSVLIAVGFGLQLFVGIA